MNGSSSRSHRGQLPFLFVNMAMTADGKTATTTELSHRSGENDQRHCFYCGAEPMLSSPAHELWI